MHYPVLFQISGLLSRKKGAKQAWKKRRKKMAQDAKKRREVRQKGAKKRCGKKGAKISIEIVSILI
jgi:hypothetical protein